MAALSGATSGVTITPTHLEAGTAGRSSGGSYSLCTRVARFTTDTVLAANMVGCFGGAVWSFVEQTYPQAGIFTVSVIASGGMIYVAEKYFAMKALKEEADKLVKGQHELQTNEEELARIRGQLEDVSGKLKASEGTLEQRGKELASTKDELAATVGKLDAANKELSTLKDDQEKNLKELKASIAQMTSSQGELKRQLDEKDGELKKETANVAAIKADNDRLQQLLTKMQDQVARMQSSFEGFKESVSGFASQNAAFQEMLPEFGDLIKQFQTQGKAIDKETGDLNHSIVDFDQKFKADLQALDQMMNQARTLTQAIFAKLREEILELRRDLTKFTANTAELDTLQKQIGDKQARLEQLESDSELQLSRFKEIKENTAAAEAKLASLQKLIVDQEQVLAAAVKKAGEQGDHMDETGKRLHGDIDRASDLLKQFIEATGQAAAGAKETS